MTTGSMGGQNSLLGGRYRLLRELGRGGFGCTYLAEDINRFNELCVLKEFFPQVNDATALQKAKQLFEREAGILYQLSHPQIPRFRELLRVQTGDRGRVFLVQDYIEGPTYQELLDTRLKSDRCFSEAEVTQLLQALLPVLNYLHGIGVIHRDIAPDNLILRNIDGLPVLIDFGGVKKLATAVEQQVGTNPASTRLGKAGYAPQEQLQAGQITPSADLYALAVTVLVLLTGESPQTLYDSYSKRWQWQSYVTLSPRLSKVLQRMLAPRAGDRYSSAAAVLSALSLSGSQPIPQRKAPAGIEPTVAVAPGRGFENTMAVSPAAMPVSPVTPPPPPPPNAHKEPSSARRSNHVNGFLQAFLGLGLLLGSIGLVWWIASRWTPNDSPPSTNSGILDESASTTPGSDSPLSEAEQSRKRSLRERQAALQVDNRFLVRVTDQLFYAQFPERQNRPLSDSPEDEALRAEWDSTANEVLDVLENHLSSAARQQLGSYTAANREQWQQQVNQKAVSSRALYDLTDAKFAFLYPQSATQDFIDQPIGQIWHGLADDRVRAIQSGDRLQEIQFEPGSFRHSLRDRLEPGEGRVYILNLTEGQLLRLNLQAASQSTRLSLYVPVPNNDVPYLLEDSTERTWSGQLPQSGYYEVTVVSNQEAPVDYMLDIGAANVTSTPTDTDAAPQEGPPN